MNPKLNTDQLQKVNDGPLAYVRAWLQEHAGDNRDLLFAYRRKIAMELLYDERGKAAARKKLKDLKWATQNRTCAHCKEPLERRYSELDRKVANDGYTEANTELIHAHCHHERQAAKGYT
jgi:hypothetical protein